MHTPSLALPQRLSDSRRWLTALIAALMLLLAGAYSVQAAGLTPLNCSSGPTNRTFDLWAKPGTITLSGAPINIWGYADSAGGAPTVPGPVLSACEGDTVQVTVHNALGTGEPTSLAIHGHTSFRSDIAGIADGSVGSYTFTAHAGTFVYQAGLAGLDSNAASPVGPRQAAMGLYGAMVVYPVEAGRAYAPSPTNGNVAFDSEALVLLSEIDPALNADPLNFDMADYAPKYWLINGQVYPATDAIQATAGSHVLLRYANAGYMEHSMGMLGLSQSIIAANGYLAPYAYNVGAETVPPGSTLDTIVTMPDSGQYPLFDGNRHIDNNGAAGLGGMVTFLNVLPANPQAVVVTVKDVNNAPQVGLSVYVFSGDTYTGQGGTTGANGEVSFTLAPGSYNFRADKDGTHFFSGGSSGVNTCLVASCTADNVTVTNPMVVTVIDSNNVPQAGVSVYAFSGATYTGKSGVTDASGRVSFTLAPGNYHFRADSSGTQFFSGGSGDVDTCAIPGCTADTVTVSAPRLTPLPLPDEPSPATVPGDQPATTPIDLPPAS